MIIGDEIRGYNKPIHMYILYINMDPYEPFSIMECQPAVLKVAELEDFFCCEKKVGWWVV